MIENNIVKIASLGALILVLSACEPAAKPNQPKQSRQLITELYADNGDGTVTDIQTNLTWQRCSVGQEWTGDTCQGNAKSFNWDNAMKLARDGWRLPTVEELDTLVQCPSGRKPSERPNGYLVVDTDGECHGNDHTSYSNPKINITVFPNTPSDWFWSSSPYTANSYDAWIVGFNYGVVGKLNRSYNSVRVRLVRAGQ